MADNCLAYLGQYSFRLFRRECYRLVYVSRDLSARFQFSFLKFLLNPCSFKYQFVVS